METMKTRQVRIIKQANPLDQGREDYVSDHEKSLIALLVPRHIEYTAKVIDTAKRRSDVLVPVGEKFRLTR